MQTFLPSGYNFSLNQLINFNDYQNGITTKIIILSIISIIFGLIAGIIAISVLRDVHNDHKHGKAGFETSLFSILGVISVCMMIVCFSFVPIFQNDLHTEDFIEQDFCYPVTNSNLVIRCIGTNNIVNNLVNDVSGKRISTNIPQSIHDKGEYPYELYVKKADSKYYLGTMKNNIFRPAKTYIASVFYKYIQYAQGHHLENKFKQNMYFIQNNKYLSGNKVQWILTNNHDTDLHLVDNTTVKESKITTN